jgi:beta-glucanase (GH16 family)
MYPENETYGAWPRSGEIDIAWARGNPPSLTGHGRDSFTSTLHWGSAATLDESDRTTSNMTLRREDFSDGFHTYGIEWSETHIFTWIDDRVTQALQTSFGQKLGTMYQRAQYALNWVLTNGTWVE